MKIYTSAPLPFQGQKRFFRKHFINALQKFPNNAIYIDLFGGSGFLSHIIKSQKPNARVIWNDYDNFQHRLALIPITNEILDKIRPLFQGIEKDKEANHLKPQILQILEQYPSQQLDMITLSANLVFSGKYAVSLEEFYKNIFKIYNVIKKNNYDIPTTYLNGVERVSTDYQNLIQQYRNDHNIVFVLDPPYLSTDIKSYKNDKYWQLKDYLHIVKEISLMDNYFYFGSNKGQLIDLFDFLSNEFNLKSPFQNANKVFISATVNKNAQYQDIMIYKHANSVKP